MTSVWSDVLDGRYHCEVIRIGDGRGRLTVLDAADDDRLLHSEEVTLAYNAQFGPDIDDVQDWQDKCVAVIDGPKVSENE